MVDTTLAYSRASIIDPLAGKPNGERMIARFIASVSIVTAMLSPALVIADDYVYRILPLGDSITHAEINRASYRYPLWKRLIDAGVKFDFVGSMNTQTDRYSKGDTPQPDYKGLQFDKDHEGHFGWEASDLVKGRNPRNKTGSGSLSQWMQGYDFDIALVHLGTNDAFNRQSSAQIADELKQVITLLRTDNPNAVILVAKLIPTKRKQGDSEAVVAVNMAIPGVVEMMNTVNSPVLLVDHFSDYDAEKDNYDGVHPNEKGEEKMAQRWFDAIMEALPLVRKRNGG